MSSVTTYCCPNLSNILTNPSFVKALATPFVLADTLYTSVQSKLSCAGTFAGLGIPATLDAF